MQSKMKIMLTSNGLVNDSLRNAFKKLVGKDEIKIVFILTAANVVDDGDKGWLINDLNNCQKVGIVDIVDISAISKDLWLPRLKKADAMVVGGGDTIYLMEQIKKSGFDKELEELLKTRIYVGISAGGMVTNKTIKLSSELIFDEGIEGKEYPGMGLVDFYVRPHLNSEYFPKMRNEFLKEIAPKFDGDLYALDDDSAVIIENGKVEIVSEGKWIKYLKEN